MVSAVPGLVYPGFYATQPPPARRGAPAQPVLVPQPQQRAGLSTTAAGKADAADRAAGPIDTQIYEGPFARVVRVIKYVSVTSSTLAVGFIPLSTYIGDETVPVTAKLAISGTVAIFAISTTGILHWFTSRYIRSIRVTAHHATMLGFDAVSDADADNTPEPELGPDGQLKPIPLEIETFNFFARPKKLTCMSNELNFHVPMVTPTSFIADGRTFWMHEELVEADWRLHTLFASLIR